MKVKFLAWTFSIFLWSMALHRVTSTPQHEDLDKPEPLMQGQVHGWNSFSFMVVQICCFPLLGQGH